MAARVYRPLTSEPLDPVVGNDTYHQASAFRRSFSARVQIGRSARGYWGRWGVSQFGMAYWMGACSDARQRRSCDGMAPAAPRPTSAICARGGHGSTGQIDRDGQYRPGTSGHRAILDPHDRLPPPPRHRPARTLLIRDPAPSGRSDPSRGAPHTAGSRSESAGVPKLEGSGQASPLIAGGVKAVPDRGEPALGGVELRGDHGLDVGI